MKKPYCLRYFLLSTTSALLGATGILLTSPALAFDPNAGTGGSTSAPVASPVQPGLPDTSLLYNNNAPVRPLYAPGTVSAAPVSATGVPEYIPPVGAIVMPGRPLYPGHTDTVQAATVPSAPVEPVVIVPPTVIAAPMPTPPTAIVAYPQPMPPVSPEVAARANDILSQQKAAAMQVEPLPTTAGAPVPTGFIAPAPMVAPMPSSAPVMAAAPVAPAVVIRPATIKPAGVLQAPAPSAVVVVVPAQPVAVAVPQMAGMPPAPKSKLTDQTRAILSQLPSHMDTVPPQKQSKITVNRVTPEIKSLLGEAPKDATFDSAGLSIKVHKPGIDTGYELNRAYTALMGNDTEQAISIYKEVLGADPQNQDALFGIAATYHRIGEIDKARPFYGALLKINPNHREGLNNFLALVAQESPQDALPELERLQQRNPDFSPIPAQIAIVMDKMGYGDRAREQMMHAIELAPDNLTYKYNLAVMLDHQQHYADAAALYEMLIQAGLHGEQLPAPLETMQKRMNFITAAESGVRPPG